jgi:Cys-Gly metallodipeptidase DUG1
VALSSDKAAVLMGRMRQPSLSLHGIQGAFSDAGGKTVIPAKVGGKFSIRYIHSLLYSTQHTDGFSSWYLCISV